MVTPEYRRLLASLKAAKGYPTLRMLAVRRFLLSTRITVAI